MGESARVTGKRNSRPPRMRPQKADGAGLCHNPDTPPQIQALKYWHKLNCCLSFRTAANPRLLSCVASLANVYGRCCRTSGDSGSPTLWTKWNRVSAWLKYVRHILWGYRSSDHVSRLWWQHCRGAVGPGTWGGLKFMRLLFSNLKPISFPPESQSFHRQPTTLLILIWLINCLTTGQRRLTLFFDSHIPVRFTQKHNKQ